MARYLFDENFSRRVAKVVDELFRGVDIGWIGRQKGGNPRSGSTDEFIRQHARRARQTIVTRDLGMIEQCVESEQPVIWIDRKGRKSVLEEPVKMAILVLQAVPKWEELLKLDNLPDIIRTSYRGTEALTLEKFLDIRGQKMKYSAPTKSRSSKSRNNTDGGLFTEVNR